MYWLKKSISKYFFSLFKSNVLAQLFDTFRSFDHSSWTTIVGDLFNFFQTSIDCFQMTTATFALFSITWTISIIFSSTLSVGQFTDHQQGDQSKGDDCH